MFYYLSKIVWFFATPSNLLPSIALLGIIIIAFTRFRKTGLTFASAGILLTFICGLLPVPNWVMLPLEQRFPTHQPTDASIDGIIVLGGSVAGDETMMRQQLNVNEAGERVIAMGDLARRYPNARIIFSGGGGNMVYKGVPEAKAVEAYSETLGIPASRIEFEGKSRTTRENAIYTREMVTPKQGERWLLVTSAWHMPRSVGCFRKAGFNVIAYPVDFRTRGPQDSRRLSAFVSGGLRRLDTGAKEWMGLIAYYFMGYTTELLPKP
ncbi:YdcF family protein [Microvirga sp. W0021]|uniref:YdcF family protein n=1 Tax=Hohaiivirga grylli TaxID=3133970 RepID=A0ABV0BJ16_9HYPH